MVFDRRTTRLDFLGSFGFHRFHHLDGSRGRNLIFFRRLARSRSRINTVVVPLGGTAVVSAGGINGIGSCQTLALDARSSRLHKSGGRRRRRRRSRGDGAIILVKRSDQRRVNGGFRSSTANNEGTILVIMIEPCEPKASGHFEVFRRRVIGEGYSLQDAR
jgi:hypothetical protein